MTQNKFYLCNIPNFYHTDVFEDIYLYMIESGLWFFGNDEPIEAVTGNIYTYNETEYNYIKTFCEAYEWYRFNTSDLELNEVNDIIDMYKEFKDK